jgi:NitT/TauT family transport system permease protein
MKKQIQKILITLSALLFWIAIWDFVSQKISLSLVLPTPKDVFFHLFGMLKTAFFYQILFTSFLRVLLGFALGLLFGFLLGYATYYNRVLHALFSPLMAIIRTAPVASIILVVLFWLEREEISTFIAFLMVLPIVWQNTILGLEKRDPLLSEMAEAFLLSRSTRFFRLDLPQVASFTLSAGKASFGLAWKAGVAAEVLALPKNTIGYEIYNAKMYLESEKLFALTLAIIAFSVILEKLFFNLLKRRENP